MSSAWEVVADRFSIEREVGAGSAGVVYRARDLQTGEAVALKVLENICCDEDARRFLREAALVADLDHPHVVRYLAYGESRFSASYLAMEWLEAERLSDRLTRRKLSLGEAIDMGLRVAGALGELHARGLVHGALRPGNLLLPGGEPARVKLSDLEVALTQRRPHTLVPREILDAAAGYMAPEQARTGEADARADVFSLGAVLFRCVARRAAFERDGLSAMDNVAAAAEAPRLSALRPDAPQELCDLVAAMLAKRKEDRPADAGVAARALAKIPALPPASREGR